MPNSAALVRGPRSAPLLNGLTAKMQCFAESVADGLSLADAYRSAFNTERMLPKTVRDEASRLFKHPRVAAAVEAIRAEREAENRMLWRTKEDRIWETLWGLIEADCVSPRSRVKALTLAAQMVGMI